MKYREIEIDLSTFNDCEFVIETVKNNKDTLVEMYCNEYDGEEHMTAVIYVDVNNVDKFYNDNPIFENIGYDDYELDEDCYDSLTKTKKATLDDMKEYGELLKNIDRLHERYTIDIKD